MEEDYVDRYHLLVNKRKYKITSKDKSPIKNEELIVQSQFFDLYATESCNDDFVDFYELELNTELERDLLALFAKLFSIMPEGIPGEGYLPCELYPKKLSSESVTFFAGSFNPWHEGHLECLKQCSDFEKNIIIVPDYNPWKDNIQNSPLKELLNLSEKTEKSFAIYPGFWAKEQRNPTESWIGNIKSKNINWLMGDDTFSSFMKWKNVEKVCQHLSKIYVVPRDFKSKELISVSEEIRKISPSLEIIFLKEHSHQDKSSTKLRK